MKKLFQDINYTNFASFLNDQLVMVDFWADWCYPCKLQKNILQKIAMDYDGKISFARVNVDDNRVIASEQNVRNLPSLIFYKNGKETRRIIGLQSEEILRNILNTELHTKKIA
jgi:thioredoxin 1